MGVPPRALRVFLGLVGCMLLADIAPLRSTGLRIVGGGHQPSGRDGVGVPGGGTFTTFTAETIASLERARQVAAALGHKQVQPLHLAVALFEEEDHFGCQVVRLVGGSIDQLHRALAQELRRIPPQLPSSLFSSDSEESPTAPAYGSGAPSVGEANEDEESILDAFLLSSSSSFSSSTPGAAAAMSRRHRTVVISAALQRILLTAARYAAEAGGSALEVTDLLLFLHLDRPTKLAMEAAGVYAQNVELVLDRLREYLTATSSSSSVFDFLSEIPRSETSFRPRLSDSGVSSISSFSSCSPSGASGMSSNSFPLDSSCAGPPAPFSEASGASVGGGARADPSASTSSLLRFGSDLTAAAAEGKLDPVIGRDKEIKRVIQVLCRRTKNNPVLIGEPGVGKTAIAEGLAQRIARGDVPSPLLEVRIISLDLAALVSGASYRGEFEGRLVKLLEELKQSSGKCVLFVDELHLLLGAGKAEGAMDAANILKPLLTRGQVKVIGATTLREYSSCVEKDAAFSRRFQPVVVEEGTPEATLSILRGLRGRYEAHHNVKIRDAALVAAVTLSHRYIQGRFLPDKAIDLVDEACATLRVQLDSQPEEIDELERKIRQLEGEADALEEEGTNNNKQFQKLEGLRTQIGGLRAHLTPLLSQYSQELRRAETLRAAQAKLDGYWVEAEAARADEDDEKLQQLLQEEIPKQEAEVLQLSTESCEDEEVKPPPSPSSSPSSSSSSSCASPVRRRAVVGVRNALEADHIAAVVSKWTGIPVNRLKEGERQKVLHLEKNLRKRVIGQQQAVRAIASSVLRSRAGLSRPQQPLGSFLFIGPTGVGKTELAKALAVEVFGDESQLLRLDMSEFSESHSLARLVGSPPGYVGHDQGGQLTEAVRRRPYAVILLDEIEKAHPNVFSLLLQVLDDGRLTDGQGRTVDFTNAMIIMTSNLASKEIIDIYQRHQPRAERLKPRGNPRGRAGHVGRIGHPSAAADVGGRASKRNSWKHPPTTNSGSSDSSTTTTSGMGGSSSRRLGRLEGNEEFEEEDESVDALEDLIDEEEEGADGQATQRGPRHFHEETEATQAPIKEHNHSYQREGDQAEFHDGDQLEALRMRRKQCYAAARAVALQAAKRHFRPEFLNRLDEVVVR
eukprot:GHVT01090790.1.p1 GENE.GHVT01090790.1~~GHVT01090790.1.p1  ORF type:complete len:1135 (-),score=313.24 GHVT01090790.1:1983-5387(-)